MMLDQKRYRFNFLLGHTNAAEIPDRFDSRGMRVPRHPVTLSYVVKQDSRNQDWHVLGFGEHLREPPPGGIGLGSQRVEVSHCDQRVLVNGIPMVEVTENEAEFRAMIDEGLAATGGPLTARERAWARKILTAGKRGFETDISAGTGVPYFAVQAIGSKGQVLGTTARG